VELGTQRLDGFSVHLGVLDNPGEVMVEGEMDHGVRASSPGAEAFQIIEVAAMHLGALGGKRLGAGIGAGETENLVASPDEFRNEGRTDEAGGAGNENTHREFSLIKGGRIARPDTRWMEFDAIRSKGPFKSVLASRGRCGARTNNVSFIALNPVFLR
jgi:hypothetical protein